MCGLRGKDDPGGVCGMPFFASRTRKGIPHYSKSEQIREFRGI